MSNIPSESTANKPDGPPGAGLAISTPGEPYEPLWGISGEPGVSGDNAGKRFTKVHEGAEGGRGGHLGHLGHLRELLRELSQEAGARPGRIRSHGAPWRYIADPASGDVHRWRYEAGQVRHEPITLSAAAWRLLRQHRGPAAPANPVVLNGPTGRAVTSLDKVQKTLRRSEQRAAKSKRRKKSKKGFDRLDRDDLDERIRARVVAEMRRQHFDTQADRVAKCGRVIGMRHCLDCKHDEKVQTRCNMWQLCPSCCRRRGRQMAAELLQHINLVPKQHKGYRWRLLTLPVRTCDDHAAAVERIGKNFARLWRTLLSPKKKKSEPRAACECEGRHSCGRDDRYPGVAAFRSIEFGSLNGNVHLHVIYYGPWVDQDDLKHAWHAITGDSYVCYVQGVSGVHAIREVAKYAVKMFATDAKSQVRFWKAITGKHCTQRYGALRHSKDLKSGIGKTESFKLSCELCGSERYHYTAVERDGSVLGESLRNKRGPPMD